MRPMFDVNKGLNGVLNVTDRSSLIVRNARLNN